MWHPLFCASNEQHFFNAGPPELSSPKMQPYCVPSWRGNGMREKRKEREREGEKERERERERRGETASSFSSSLIHCSGHKSRKSKIRAGEALAAWRKIAWKRNTRFYCGIKRRDASIKYLTLPFQFVALCDTCCDAETFTGRFQLNELKSSHSF